MKINVKFNRNWLYEGGGIHASSVRRLVRECAQKYQDDVSVVHQDISECVLDFSSNASGAALSELRTIVAALFGASGNIDAFCTISALDNAEGTAPQPAPPQPPAEGAPSVRAAAPDPAGTPAAAAQEPPAGGKIEPTAIERIDARIGMAEFKALCHEIAQHAPRIIAGGTQRFFFSESYLFSAGRGSGYTKSLKQLNDLLLETGLFDEARSIEEFELPDPADPDVANALAKLESTLQRALQSPRILSLDLSLWRRATGSALLKKLLLNLFETNRRCLIVFRLPYLEQDELKQIASDISDVMSVRTITFPPFTDTEIRALAEEELAEYGLRMADDAWPAYLELVNAEKRDGYFYGFHTVRKVLGGIVRNHELSAAAHSDNDNVITAQSVLGLVRPNESETDSAQELEHMIGMENIAERIYETISQILYARSHDVGESPSMHMCFVGNPGTGKTTAARIIGKIMRERGVLRVGKFVEHKGRDFVGRYIGETTPKTTAICQSAYGSVLFIDEAYSLYQEDSPRDYGQEAIDALVAEMENHRDDMIVIFAGYPDEMQRLLDANPGLRSRVPYTINFPSYTSRQLYDIFQQMSSRHFAHEDGFDKRAEEYFMSLPESVLSDRRFGNGRFVRNLYERIWSKALRRIGSSEESPVLTVADFDAAAAEFDLAADIGRPEKIHIGF